MTDDLLQKNAEDNVAKVLNTANNLDKNQEILKTEQEHNYNFRKEAEAKESTLTHSETIGSFAGALAKAQGQLSNAKKDSEGYGYSYSDIGSNFDAIRVPFSENGLAIIHGHSLKNTKAPTVITTVMLAHESGEWVRSTLEIPLTIMKGLSISQSVGVICTYSRRYLLQAVTGLASEDNDATTK